jgi:hypothetical protein
VDNMETESLSHRVTESRINVGSGPRPDREKSHSKRPSYAQSQYLTAKLVDNMETESPSHGVTESRIKASLYIGTELLRNVF